MSKKTINQRIRALNKQIQNRLKGDPDKKVSRNEANELKRLRQELDEEE